MLNKIIGFSLQNRILVLVASVLLLIGGTYTAMHTEVDVFPDLNAPTVVIMTRGSGTAGHFSRRNGCKRCNGCAPCTLFLNERFFCSLGRIRLGYRYLSCPADCQ